MHIFGGNPLYQATKRYLKTMVKNTEKLDGQLIPLSFGGWAIASAYFCL